MSFDVAAVRKTQNQINKMIWVCATIAMSASAIAGITGFWNLQQDGWGVASGITTSVAVDVALWVALTSDRLMERAGLAADGPWARTVRWGTAVMSIFLNVLAAVLSPLKIGFKVLLIVIHAFAPLIMVGLAELRTENGRKLAQAEQTALADEARRAAEEQARLAALAIEEDRRRALDTPIRTPSERISPSFAAVGAAPPKQLPARPSPSKPSSSFRTVTPLRSATPARKPATAQSNRRGTPVKDPVFDWLDANYVHGRTQVGDLVDALGGSRNTYKKLLADWRKNNEERTKEAAS